MRRSRFGERGPLSQSPLGGINALLSQVGCALSAAPGSVRATREKIPARSGDHRSVGARWRLPSNVTAARTQDLANRTRSAYGRANREIDRH